MYYLNFIALTLIIGVTSIKGFNANYEKVIGTKIEQISNYDKQININHPNNILAKYYDDKTYVAGSNCLFQIDSNNQWTNIYDGYVKLGTFYKDCLYFLSYPDDRNNIKNEKCGVIRLNLNSLESEQVLPWNDEFWMVNTIFAENDILFLNSLHNNYTYLINEKNAIEKEPESIITLPNDLLDRKKSGDITFVPDWIFNYYTCGILAFYNNKLDDKTLHVYNTNTELEFKNIYNDVLFVQHGFVYRSEDRSKIFYTDLHKNTQLLYDASQNNCNINYGTYDTDYLYCFQEFPSEKLVICYRISWDGSKEELFRSHCSKGAVSLNLTVLNEWLYYYDETEQQVIQLALPEN